MKVKNSYLSIKNNRKIKTFLFFLLLSSVFWFLTALSESYNYVTTYQALYTEIPSNLVYLNKEKQPIEVQIETSGFRILGHRINAKDIVIPVSKFKKQGKYIYYFLPNRELVTLQKQFTHDKLIWFVSDSIVLSLGALESKQVPVIANLNLSFKSGFKLKEIVKITPDSVLVRGPEQYLDSINYINTQKVSLVDIQNNFSKTLALQLPKNEEGQLNFSVDEVELSGEVAKFTEEEIALPIHVLDIPKNRSISLFQDKVVLKYLVSFEDYKKISPASFEVSGRYQSDSLDQGKLHLFLSKKPDFIYDYKLQEEYMNYSVKKY